MYVVEGGFRGRMTITGVAVQAHFIFHLHHDDRALLFIDAPNMPHESCKGLRIGGDVRLAERRENLNGTRTDPGARKTRGVQ